MLVAGLFEELTGTKGLVIIHGFKAIALAAARCETGAGEFHARVVQLVRRHQHRATVGVHAIGDIVGGQLLDHLIQIAVVQIGKQYRVFRLAGPQGHVQTERHRRRQAHQDTDLAQQ